MQGPHESDCDESSGLSDRTEAAGASRLRAATVASVGPMRMRIPTRYRARCVFGPACVAAVVWVIVAASTASATVRATALVPSTDVQTGMSPTAIRIADFDQDGTNDLAVLNFNANSVSLFGGDGSGGLKPPSTISLGTPASYGQDMAADDLNLDGDLDLIVPSGDGFNHHINVLLGGPGATFAPPVMYPTIRRADRVVVGRFSADRLPDVAVELGGGFSDPNEAAVMLGTGGGILGPAANYLLWPAGWIAAWGLAAGDINQDHHTDLITGQWPGGDVGVGVALGAVDGTFLAPRTLSSPHASTLRVADLNSDGRDDLVTSGSSGVVSVMLGGVGMPSSHADYAVGGVPGDLTIGDVNADGALDVLTVDDSLDRLTVLLGDGAGALTRQQAFALPAGSAALGLAVEDLDRDGRQEVAVSETNTNRVLVFRNVTDVIAPTTTITGGPATGKTIATSKPAFSFTSSEADSAYLCEIDDGSPTPCESPWTLGALSSGSHSFTVAAVDAAGNPDASPARREFVVDVTPPESKVISAPRTGTSSRSAVFTFGASEQATFQCKLDAGPWRACVSPLRVRVAPGPHRFQLVATDVAGNEEIAPRALDWQVERLLPPFRVTAVLGGGRHGRRVGVISRLVVRQVGDARVQISCPRCADVKGVARSVRRSSKVIFEHVTIRMGRTAVLRVIAVAPRSLGRFQTFVYDGRGLQPKTAGCLSRELKPVRCG